MPIHLMIGYSRPNQDIRFPVQLLESLCTLEELQLNRVAIDGPEILQYLSRPHEARTGQLAWPCPRLAVLRVNGNSCGWEGLLSFLRARYEPSGEGYPGCPASPCRLRLLTVKSFEFDVTLEQLEWINTVVDSSIVS